MARIVWDTNLFIYLSQEHPKWGESVRDLRRRMRKRHDDLLATTLTMGEALAGAHLSGDEQVVKMYMEVFTSPRLMLISFDMEAAQIYGRIRVDRGIKPADAVQLACAAAAGADLFITNDDRLSRKVVPGIGFITSLARAPL